MDERKYRKMIKSCKKKTVKMFVVHGAISVILCCLLYFIAGIISGNHESGQESVTLDYECHINTVFYNAEEMVKSKISVKEEAVPVSAVKQTRKNKRYYYDVPLGRDLQDYIYAMCKKYGIRKPSLIFAVISQESDFNQEAESATNDHGLMQINDINLPELKEKLGITDILDPYQNIQAGVYILSGHLKKYNMHKSLMCYNMGRGNAGKLWEQGICTSRYSREVMQKYRKFEEERNKPQHS